MKHIEASGSKMNYQIIRGIEERELYLIELNINEGLFCLKIKWVKFRTDGQTSVDN